MGQLRACLKSHSQTQTRSDPVFPQSPLHLNPTHTLPPPRPEVHVLNHTTYQRLCITNQSSNCTLYYRTCSVLENRCHHENHIFCSFSIWHVNICNLNDAWTEILAFNINMGTHNAPRFGMLPHSDFNSGWLDAFPGYTSASRSCWCLLSWKCGHILVLQTGDAVRWNSQW